MFAGFAGLGAHPTAPIGSGVAAAVAGMGGMPAQMTFVTPAVHASRAWRAALTWNSYRMGFAAAALIGVAVLTICLVLLVPWTGGSGLPAAPTAVCSLPLLVSGITPPAIAIPQTPPSNATLHDAVLAFSGMHVWCYDVQDRRMLLAGVALRDAPTWLVGPDGGAFFASCTWTGISAAAYLPTSISSASPVSFAQPASPASPVPGLMLGSSNTDTVVVLSQSGAAEIPAQTMFPGARGLLRVPSAVAATAIGASPTDNLIQSGQRVTIRAANTGLYWTIPPGTTHGASITPIQPASDARLTDVAIAISDIELNPISSDGVIVRSITGAQADTGTAHPNSVGLYAGAVACTVGGAGLTVGCDVTQSGSNANPIVATSPYAAQYATPLILVPGPTIAPPQAGYYDPPLPYNMASSGVYIFPQNVAYASGLHDMHGGIRSAWSNAESPPIISTILTHQPSLCINRYVIEELPSSSTPRLCGIVPYNSPLAVTGALEAHWSDGSVDAYAQLAANVASTVQLLTNSTTATVVTPLNGLFLIDAPPQRTPPLRGATPPLIVGALVQWSSYTAATSTPPAVPASLYSDCVTVTAAGVMTATSGAVPFSISALNSLWSSS